MYSRYGWQAVHHFEVSAARLHSLTEPHIFHSLLAYITMRCVIYSNVHRNTFVVNTHAVAYSVGRQAGVYMRSHST